jgi:hypothetical protein
MQLQGTPTMVSNWGAALDMIQEHEIQEHEIDVMIVDWREIENLGASSAPCATRS